MLWCVKTSELTDAVRSFHQDYMSINEAKVNSGHCIVLLRNTRWVYSYSVSRLNDLIHLALYTPLKATCVHHWSHGTYTTHQITGSETLKHTNLQHLFSSARKENVRHEYSYGTWSAVVWHLFFFFFLFFQNLALLVLISVESCCI